jgi:hypothetical protein
MTSKTPNLYGYRMRVLVFLLTCGICNFSCRDSTDRFVALDDVNWSFGASSVPSILKDTRRASFYLTNLDNVAVVQSPEEPRVETNSLKRDVESLRHLNSFCDYQDVTCGSTETVPASELNLSLVESDANGKAAKASFQNLVNLGPKSIPILLESLDDKTPTRIEIQFRSSVGEMRFERNLVANYASVVERTVVGAFVGNSHIQVSDRIDTYTVKVGDICFELLGRIVGRRYEVVRYQPVSCEYISSPTVDPKLCECIRRLWTNARPSETLLNSLLRDFCTRSDFKEASLDPDWEYASDLQIIAATRMQLYFPEQTAKILVRRLRSMQIDSPKLTRSGESQVTAFIRREIANEIRTAKFISAMSLSTRTEIQSEISRIESETDDIKLREACQRKPKMPVTD